MTFIKRNPLNLTILILVTTIVIGIGASIASNAVEKDVNIYLTGSLMRDGKTLSLDASVIANSNEVITYDLKFSNTGKPINNFRVVGQIPAGTTGVNSATAITIPAADYPLEDGSIVFVPPYKSTLWDAIKAPLSSLSSLGILLFRR